MNGGRLARRVLRGASLVGATALSGALLAATMSAGVAQANDRSTSVACADDQSGVWWASITFASIDVHEGHPVLVTFGSASTTLSDPGPDGTVTLTQDLPSGQDAATIDWSIVRNGTTERSGVEQFDKPAGCEAVTTTTEREPPTSAPPTTMAEPAGSTPAGSSAPGAVDLPVTGLATGWTTLAALAAVAAGSGSCGRRDGSRTRSSATERDAPSPGVHRTWWWRSARSPPSVTSLRHVAHDLCRFGCDRGPKPTCASLRWP